MRELLGPQASDREVKFCEISIISQCMNPVVARRREARGVSQDGPPEIDDIEAYADHVLNFSLAGIQALREVTGKKQKVRKAGEKQP